MSNLQGNGPTNEYKNRLLPAAGGRPSAQWIAAAVVAVIVLLGLGYAFQGRMTGSTDMVEHRASTDAPVASPVNPTPNAAPAAPAATPKP
jgi:hypothetical protein